jgi:PKHD-type hydroxylase
MILHLPQLLSPDEVATARTLLGDDASWIDGRTSAGGQAVSQKHNLQLAQDSDSCRTLQRLVLAAVQREPLLLSAALPRRVFNPLFNRYDSTHSHYGAHIDGAVLRSQASQEWVRTDLSCTVFLNEPQAYDGGELCVQAPGGERRFKLAAGDAILYPGTHVHEVTPVTRGVRLASFFWIESMVRSEEQRRILFDLDMNLLKLRAQLGETAETTALTGVYHNLLRQWANT